MLDALTTLNRVLSVVVALLFAGIVAHSCAMSEGEYHGHHKPAANDD